jgi:glycosyltransferase involved in cell wall biosynthesis
MMMRVVYVNTSLAQFSVPFQEGVRRRLAEYGVQYEAIYGQPDPNQAAKGDEASLGWERKVTNRYIRIGPYGAVWQPVLKDIWNCDLAIVGQENRRLVNYVAQILGGFRPSRLAFWGHGRNFQAGPEPNLAERWKRFWATRCDWWFTYTEGTGKLIEDYGFPPERITVFQNAIDTLQLRRWADEIGADELNSLRRQLGITTDKIAVYVGGLYDLKRIDFLIEAAKKVRRRIPDFQLIIVGGGPDRSLVEAAAAADTSIRYLGPRFGREKAAILRLGRVFLMPGLVGLAILDGSALGVPIITTAYPYHSPEIGYLKSGESGLVVENWQSPTAYADAVISVLLDDVLRAKLAVGAMRMAQAYTIENMVHRFCDGVLAAVAAPKRK